MCVRGEPVGPSLESPDASAEKEVLPSRPGGDHAQFGELRQAGAAGERLVAGRRSGNARSAHEPIEGLR